VSASVARTTNFYVTARKARFRYVKKMEEDMRFRRAYRPLKMNAAEKEYKGLVEVSQKRMKFYRSPDGTAYADVWIKGHRETWKIGSSAFNLAWCQLYEMEFNEVPQIRAIHRATNYAQLNALRHGRTRAVHVRVGSLDGHSYIDLGDRNGRHVQVSPGEWKIVSSSLVRFTRFPGMLPLPEPTMGGSIHRLRDFIRVSDRDFILIVSYLVATLHEPGPYPILVLTGEQGSSKTTTTHLLRSLVDPHSAPLLQPPRNAKEIFISAQSSHLLAYDNLSELPRWMSDALARIATGAANASRRLWTDQDQALIQVERPIVLNGITDFVESADLADRCIFIRPKQILAEERRPRSELLREFQVEQPRLFGALLDVLAHGLKTLPAFKAGHLPRMADFAKLATASEGAFTKPGAFNAAYERNRAQAIEDQLSHDPVVAALQHLELPWSGRAALLLTELKAVAADAYITAKDLPKNAKALTRDLHRLAPLLRERNIDAYYYRTNRVRGWMIEEIEAEQPSLQTSSIKVRGRKLDKGDDGDDSDNASASAGRATPTADESSA
jgi:hypothetical protein